MFRKVLSVILAAAFLLAIILTFVLPSDGNANKHGGDVASVVDPPGGEGIAQANLFVPDEILTYADSREHALQIASEYGLELKNYIYGIAVLLTTDPESEVAQSASMSLENIPELSLSFIYDLLGLPFAGDTDGTGYRASAARPGVGDMGRSLPVEGDKLANNEPGPGQLQSVVTTTAEAGTYGFEFPDTAFRAEILKILNALDGGARNENSLIAGDLAVLSSLEFLDVSEMGIADLTGLRHLSGLVEFHCALNELTSIDVSGNKALEILDLWSNDISSLNVSENKALTLLDCGENDLTVIDVSGNTALIELWCDSNKLTALDLSKNTGLLFLMCDSNLLTEVDVTLNKDLMVLDCRFNKITALELTVNKSLIVLMCAGNLLTQLDVTPHPGLRTLDCGYNDLTSLNLSNNPRLESIDVRYNWLPGPEAVTGKPDIEWDKEVWNPAWNRNWTPFMFSPQKEAPLTFEITIIGGGAGHSAAPNPAEQGQTVTLNAGTPADGRQFVNWTSEDVTITDPTNASGATFEMPAKAVTVTANWGPVQLPPEPTPNAAIDFPAEQLTGLTGGSYSFTSGLGAPVAEVIEGTTFDIPEEWMGYPLIIVKLGNGTTTSDSLPQELEIPARPNAPDVSAIHPDKINGTGGIKDTTTAMEYKTALAGTWKDCTQPTTTELEPGAYLVRFKATSTAFASKTAGVTIDEYEPVKEPLIAWVQYDGDEEVYIDKPVEFLIKLKANEVHPNTNAFSITITVSNLTYLDGDALAGFGRLNGIKWTTLDDGSKQGTFMFITTANEGNGINLDGEYVLAKLTFEAVAVGKASIKLDEVFVTPQADPTDMTERTFAFIPEKIKTAVVDIIDTPEFIVIYSNYDLNKDGVIDLLDISIALRVYLSAETDDDWNVGFSIDKLGKAITPALCDVNGDGVVDMLDIADILAFFGPAPPQLIDPRD